MKKSKLKLKDSSSGKGLAPVVDKDILTFVSASMKTYGTEVNLERSVPDFRDGLKPVVRRLLWSMHQLPGDGNIKSARLVGDAMGRYHPHGDGALYDALVKSANNSVPPFWGVGNWGTLVDVAAAHRYTNIRMSLYGKTFFGKHYTPTIDLVPNFDRSDKEPVVLPALLPNLLFNGTGGIGVGMATDIPAFTPTSVLKIMIRLLDGESLTVKDYVQGLDWYYQYGGEVVKDKANRKRMAEFFASHKGTVEWRSPLEIDRDAKKITLTKFAPEVNPIKLIEDKIKPLKEVKSAIGGKGLSWVVQVRKDINYNEFDKLVEKIEKLMTSKISYNVCVTEREVIDTGDKVDYQVNFIICSIPELFQRWLKWRCKLEAKSLDWRIKTTEADIAYIKLLIYACDCLDIIFKGLRQSDPKAYLVKHMKITPEQADQILDLKVRQLSKLDQDKLKAKLAEAQDHLKGLIAKRKKPSLEVKKFLELCVDRFESYSQWAGTNQFALTAPKKSVA